MDIKTLGTIAAVLVVFATAIYASVKVSKNKWNIVGTAETAKTVITYAQAIATAISPFLPDIADNIIEMVLKYAQQAVTHVEATYKAAIATGQTATDMRTVEAKSLIKSALALEGIAETAQIDKLIDTIIPLLVLALPKTHETAAEATQTDTKTA
jgi:leucyl-tRNA synthetase